MKYIFFTADVHPIGGMQWLVAGKAEVLENKNWEVYVFYPSHDKRQECAIDSLEKYDNGGFYEMIMPPYMWTKVHRDLVLKKMCNIIGEIEEDEEIIIESHSDCTSQWGELLAKRINAKHFLFLCNEIYRGKDKHYEENLEYYEFKLNRRELAGEMDDIFYKLFEDYKDIKENQIRIFKYDENPIRNVENECIEHLQKEDFNICYIGREEKGYVPNIYEGVSRFANNHRDKKIGFIILGKIEKRREQLINYFSKTENVIIKELGNIVPIPRQLFSKVDVVIAGSGSAKCAAYEGAYAIIADASNYLANGVLGYDTNDELYHRNIKQKTFEELLEDVLILRKYDRMNNTLPPYMGPYECTEQNFSLIETSEESKDFYPEKKLCAHRVSYIGAMKMDIYHIIYRINPKVLNVLKKKDKTELL